MWEVKTMVAIILHLLEVPGGKVPLTTAHLFSRLGECLPLTSSKFPSPRVTFSERPQVKALCCLLPPTPTVLFAELGWETPLPHQTLLTCHLLSRSTVLKPEVVKQEMNRALVSEGAGLGVTAAGQL